MERNKNLKEKYDFEKLDVPFENARKSPPIACSKAFPTQIDKQNFSIVENIGF